MWSAVPLNDMSNAMGLINSLVLFLLATDSVMSAADNTCGNLQAQSVEIGANATIIYTPTIESQQRRWYFRKGQKGGHQIFDYTNHEHSTRYDEYQNDSFFIFYIYKAKFDDSGEYLVNCGNHSPAATYLKVTVGKSSTNTKDFAKTTTISKETFSKTQYVDLETVESKSTVLFKNTQSQSTSATGSIVTETIEGTTAFTEETVDDNFSKQKDDNIATLICPVVGGICLVILITVFLITRNKMKTKKKQRAKRNCEQNHDERQECSLQETSTDEQVLPVTQASDTATTDYASIVLRDDNNHENKLNQSQQNTNVDQDGPEYARVVKKQREICNKDERIKKLGAEQTVPEYSAVLKKKSEACNMQKINEKMDNEQDMPEYSCVVKKQKDTCSSKQSNETRDAGKDTEENASIGKGNTSTSTNVMCNERADKTKGRDLVYVELDFNNRPASRPVVMAYEATEYVSIDIKKTATLKEGNRK